MMKTISLLFLLLSGCTIYEKQPVADKTILFYDSKAQLNYFDHIQGEPKDVYHYKGIL